MVFYTCAECKIRSCMKPADERENMPANCPMREEGFYEQVMPEYDKEENNKFFKESLMLEREGKSEWPRVREIVEYAYKMGYKKIGLAFCVGLKEEAEYCAKIFRANGLEVVSVICRNGGYSKACYTDIPADAPVPSEEENLLPIHKSFFLPLFLLLKLIVRYHPVVISIFLHIFYYISLHHT